MKKQIAALAVVGLLTGGAGTAQAQGTPQVTVNQSPVVFNGQPPISQGGRVLVPLRGVLEKLGAFVDFSSKTQTVTAFRGATRITLPIGGRQALVNDRAVALDAPAQILNGSTLVPLRFVAEALGASVNFDVGTNTVAINTTGAAPPASGGVSPRAPGAPATTTIVGTVSAVYPDQNPPRLVVKIFTSEGEREQTIPLRANATLTLQRPNVRPRVIELNRIHAGDQVAMTVNVQGIASAVNVIAPENDMPRNDAPRPGKNPPRQPEKPRNSEPVSSVFKGEFLEARKDGNKYILKMTDGREITVGENVDILYDNQKIGPDDLRSGDDLTIAVDPETKRGTRIIVAVEK